MEKYSEIIQLLLKKIGIETEQDAEAFINPSYDAHMHDPFLMSGMSDAVNKILDTIDSGDKIAIYSDFDADGIPAGVILHDLFKRIGFDNFVNYIPHRDKEGYGLHKEAIEQLAKEGVSLIVTVDVGITAIESVEYTNNLGVDVIITDHHEPKDDLPQAMAILNPKQVHCNYPFKELCGAGIAYKLVQALIIKGRQHSGLVKNFNKLPDGWEKWLLDLVALATVADMVPLMGENRTLVYWGLLVLRKSRRVGIQALCNKLRISQQLLDENDIGFSIAPRINAASRMGHPEDAFNLLSTKDQQEAGVLANKLESLNNKRKGQVAAIVRSINTKLEHLKDQGDLPSVIVVGDPSWSPALVGLAAGSLADKLGKVVCVWGREGTGILKGSCRSGDGASIVDMFKVSGDALLYYGGHHAAGGFAVSDESVHTLSDKLIKARDSLHINNDNKQQKNGDIELALRDVNTRTLEEFQLLAPFGIGNPKPVFSFTSVQINSIRHFGKEENHIEIHIRDSAGTVRKASKFFATSASFTRDVIEGDSVTMLANLEHSSFAGRRSLELRIVDII
jgi:single-stranded-DNA-specific exonuclease